MLSWGVCLCVVAGGLQAMEGARVDWSVLEVRGEEHAISMQSACNQHATSARVDWSVLEVRGEVMGAQAGAAAQRGPAVKAREDGEATCVVRSEMRGPIAC